MKQQKTTILSIETSCDDTGIAVLEVNGGQPSPKASAWQSKTPSFNVLSNIISSQIEVHKKYGGVFPAMAKREHQKNLISTLELAFKEAELLNPKSQIPNPNKILKSKIQTLNSILEREPELFKKLVPFLKKYQKPEIDLIAVTNGPGLEPCLWVGINFAKAISYFWDIPIIPTNHIEGHILVNLLTAKKINFPAIALVVSGGHTQIILAKSIGKYKILGETRDDAAGECFDKAAKILGLNYPGGPEISKSAKKLSKSPTSVNLPRPMINTKDYDFSFSGLKTAILYAWQKSKKTEHQKIAFAREIQQAIIDVLIKKTIKAAKDFGAKTIILGGGVSANQELKNQFAKRIQKELAKTEFLIPDISLSTDNGLMTAVTAWFCRDKKTSWENVMADANLRI
jgi:N6-L-threonylcarbamoyladenine synthase